jgi:hypothetical protein
MKFGSAVIVAGLLSMAGTAMADTAAFSPTGGTYESNIGSGGNDGLFFTVGASPILVTALGYFHDGGVHTNSVGIFRVSDNALMGSTSVTTTSGSAPLPSFDYASTSISLAANTSYVVVGHYWYDILANYTTNNLGTAAGITYDGYKYDTSSTLGVPSIGYSPAYIGPNFQFQLVPLPAAAISGGATLASVGALALIRRRRNTVA